MDEIRKREAMIEFYRTAKWHDKKAKQQTIEQLKREIQELKEQERQQQEEKK